MLTVDADPLWPPPDAKLCALDGLELLIPFCAVFLLEGDPGGLLGWAYE